MFKYPLLLQNGKIFPSWIVHKYKDYIYKINDDEDYDPCISKKDTKLTLRSYQEFISKYLDYQSPYNGILLYHGVGSGKTATAIEVYNNLYKYTDQWNVFLLIKASLKKEWEGELDKWMSGSEDVKKHKFSNILFCSYDSPIADQKFFDLVKQSDRSKKNLFIIDEVHNFIRNVYGNIVGSQGTRAQKIYDYMLQERIENPSTKIVLISGTPIINKPFELTLTFNLLRPNIFPKSETEFEQIFITTEQGKYSSDKSSEHINKMSLNPDTLNMFQRRILGLVSYFDAADPKAYASKNINYINLPMSEYHEQIYNFYHALENKVNEFNTKKSKKQDKLYKAYTRQACNFVFPTVYDIDGEHRPRPSTFKLSDKEAEEIMEGMDISKMDAHSLAKKQAADKYKYALKHYIDSFVKYCKQLEKEDKEHNKSLYKDAEFIKTEKEKQNTEDITDIILKYLKDNKCSKLFKMLYNHSPKYLSVCLYILYSKGPALIYSNYVEAEGLKILMCYLDIFGFGNVTGTRNNKSYDYLRYAEYHGSITPEQRKEFKDRYNEPDNMYGKLIKVILISPSGTEGLSLMNVRQVHLMEPHWNEVRMTQMIGRGIRQCSHKLLPKEERHVEVYRYKVVFDPNRKRESKGKFKITETTDEYIEKYAKNKNDINEAFLNAVKQAAVDCNLNLSNNRRNNPDLRCFNFEDKALLNKQIYPAYKMDIKDDKTIQSGLNAKNNTVQTVKVYKITAVIERLKNKKDEIKTENNITYTEPKQYWVYKEEGYVYDLEGKNLVGKLKKENNIYVKTPDNNFIIDFVVPYGDLIF